MMFSEFHGFSLTFADYELIQLKEYSRIVETQLEHKLANFNDWVTKQAAHLSEAEKHDLYASVGLEHTELSQIHPQILRQSLVIALASFLEKTLNSLCQDFRKHWQIDLSFHDIHGKGITRAQKYLKKVIKIDFPDTNAAWQNILLINEIRNFYVHSEGNVSGELVKRIETASENRALTKLYPESIDLDSKFVPFYIENIEKFVRQLQQKVLEKAKHEPP